MSNFLLSIDIDDLAIAACNFHLGRDNPPDYSSQLAQEVLFTLDILDKLKLRATFFVNAQYCIQYNDVIKEIVARGNIISSHGFKHFDVRKMSLEEFHKDVDQSIEILSKYQSTVYGYRAPAFSMRYDRDHLKILKNCGIAYISNGPSIKECNIPRSQNIEELDFGVMHVPISSAYFLNGLIQCPIGYASIARLLPGFAYFTILKKEVRNKNFFHFYFHPFELTGLNSNTKTFLQKHLPLSVSLKNAVFRMNCGSTNILTKILSMFQFKPIETFWGFLPDPVQKTQKNNTT